MFEGTTTPSRESKRKNLFYKFEIVDKDNRLIGHLGDLTLNGLKVISSDPIPLQQDLQLKINLPPGISEKKQIEFNGEIAWSRKVGEYYHIGFKALHSNPDNDKIINVIMDLLATPDSLIL